MRLQPRRLPIGDIFAIGWKLLQFPRRSEQRRWRDLTNDKHIEQTVVDECTGSDLDTAASLAPVPNDCYRSTASNFTAGQAQLSLIMMKVDRQNCPHHGVGGRTKKTFEFR